MTQIKHVLLFVVLLCSLTVSAEDFVKNGIYYNITQELEVDGGYEYEVEVTFCGDYYNSFSNEYIGDIVIPSSTLLGNFNIGCDVTGIGESSFRFCNGLTSVTIPESITGIGNYAFYNCNSLASVTIAENSRLESIGNEAFRACSSLTSITLPASVTSIGDRAFCDCLNLTSITCKAMIPPTIGSSNTFSEVNKSIPVYVPAGSIESYRTASYWSGFTNFQPIVNPPCGDNLTWTLSDTGELTIEGTGAMFDFVEKTAPWYKHWKEIKTVVLREGVTSIGGGTFMDKDPLGKKMWHMVKDHLDGLSCSLYLGKGTVAKGMVLDGPESGKLLDRFKDTRSVIGNKKFIAGTESGYSFLDFPKIDSEMVKEIAKINARNLVTLRYLGVRKWTFFTFDNDGMYESKKWGSGRIDYGMWNRAYGSPKPHAATWAVSARALAHVTDPMDASPCPDVYCYVFKKGNKTLAAFWAYVKEDIDAQIDLPSAWSGMDFLGRPLKGKAGLQNFKLNDRVLYLEFDAPQEAVVKAFRNGKYILPAVYVAAHRVDGGKVSVTVKNKLAGDLNAVVTLNKLPARNITVKRGTVADVVFDCPPGNGTLEVTVLANGVKYHLKKDDEWYGVARLSAPPAIQNGVLKGFEKVQPLVMDSVKHLKPADIDSHGIWTGKDDLSAQIYLGYDKSFFYIGAEILDDAHIVRYAGELSWNQDSVQCAFDTGNNSFDNQLSPGGYDSDDREFIFADTPKGPETFCYAGTSDIERKVIGKPQIFRSNGKTLYLVRFPWSQLGRLKPVSGTVFGFNIVAFDFDAKATTTSCQMEFSPGITYGKTPALFKRFILK